MLTNYENLKENNINFIIFSMQNIGNYKYISNNIKKIVQFYNNIIHTNKHTENLLRNQISFE